MTPRKAFSFQTQEQRAGLSVNIETGTIRPELHGHFAEHLGSCVWRPVGGKNSKIPNINGYRKQAVEYLKALGVPVLRWPGGCFADDYHWRDGIGPLRNAPSAVNLHWGNYTEDNSFGTHEFIGLCRLIGAEPYFAGNVGSGTPHELRDWVEYCNYPKRQHALRRARRQRLGRAVQREVLGRRQRELGLRRQHDGPRSTPIIIAASPLSCGPFGDTKPFLIACGPNGNDTDWTRR